MEQFPASNEPESQPYSDEVAAYAAQALKRNYSHNKSDAGLQDAYEDLIEGRADEEYEVIREAHRIAESKYLPVIKIVSGNRPVAYTQGVVEEYEKLDSMLDRVRFISERSILDQIQILNSDLFSDEKRRDYEEQLEEHLDAIAKGSERYPRDRIEKIFKDASVSAIMTGTKYHKMCEKAEAIYQAANPDSIGDALSVIAEEDARGRIVHESAEGDARRTIEAYEFIEAMTRQKYPDLSGEALDEKVIENGARAINNANHQRELFGDSLRIPRKTYLIISQLGDDRYQGYALQALSRDRKLAREMSNVTFERVEKLGEQGFKKALDLGASAQPFYDEYYEDEDGEEHYAEYNFPWLSKMPADIIEKCHSLKKRRDANDMAEKFLTEPLLRQPASPRKTEQLFHQYKEGIGALCDFYDQDYRFNDLGALGRAVQMADGSTIEQSSRAFVEDAANFVPPENLKDLPSVAMLYAAANKIAGSTEEPAILDALHQIQALYFAPEANWLLKGDIAGNISFPIGQRDSAKYAWCSRNSLTNLGPDWGEQTIGKFLYTRLQNGIEPNLHDASMLLSVFRLPNEAYDIAAIERDRADGRLKDFESYRVSLSDARLENNFLGMLFNVPSDQKSKIRLPTKDQKIYQLFSSPTAMFLYKEILKYWNVASGKDELRLKVETRLGADLEEFKKEYVKSNKIHDDLLLKENIRENFFRFLDDADYEEVTPHDISLAMSSLAKLGQARRDYVDDASRFLTRHMVAPSDSLRQVWSIRAAALADGVEDNVSSIESWAKANDTKTYYLKNQGYYESIGLSPEDVANHQDFINELSRDYDPDTILDELAAYKNWNRKDKILPPDEKYLKYEDGKKYVGTILDKDDPRGMTIGVDTGCCMTIQGASESCIESGYKDEDAGFFVLYEGSGKIMAQSYFYTNQEENPEVLVMDNIESNAGRGANKIVDLYTEYFREYLLDRFRENPDWQIREVHIGTRYGDLVKPIVTRLEATDVIRNSHENVYTDASDDQRLLFRLTDEEIAEARNRGRESSALKERLVPIHTTFERTSPLGPDQAEAIAYLESELYPESMRQYDDADFLYSELAQPGVSEYSFFINSETDATKRPVGYCLAYEAGSETNPGFQGKNLYVADFGITEGNRGFSAALGGLDEILSRASEGGIDQIEMAARESTSYRLLTSDFGRRLLARRGYNIEDFGLEDSFGENESTYLLRLTKTA